MDAHVWGERGVPFKSGREVKRIVCWGGNQKNEIFEMGGENFLLEQSNLREMKRSYGNGNSQTIERTPRAQQTRDRGEGFKERKGKEKQKKAMG